MIILQINMILTIILALVYVYYIIKDEGNNNEEDR